jgi:hypothetical protein
VLLHCGAAAADAKLVADAGAGEAADLGVVALAQEPYGRLLERWQLAPGSCTNGIIRKKGDEIFGILWEGRRDLKHATRWE